MRCDRAVASDAARISSSRSFPRLKASIPYDTTPYVRKSIEEVVKTLGEAILLVFLVMWLFLQNLRATLIPTIAVPVVLLGTFGVLPRRLFDQHADHVRGGARDRPAGR
jgi:multidrug efflux pump